MSSGASVAYEKPRSGRSSCMLETPRSSRIASARTPFSASWVSTIEKSPRRKRADTPVVRRKRSKYGRTVGSRSIAITLPVAVEVAREQRRVAAGAEGAVDERVPGLEREQRAYLVRENRDVVSRVGLQDVRQHALHFP